MKPNRYQILIDKLHRQIEALNQIMPCGHMARYVIPPTGDSGTTYNCAICLMDAAHEHSKAQQVEIDWLCGLLGAADAKLIDPPAPRCPNCKEQMVTDQFVSGEVYWTCTRCELDA